MSSDDIQRKIETEQAKLRTWQKRLAAVQEAKVYFQDNLDDYLDAYNKKMKKVENDFMYGYGGFSNRAVLEAQISHLEESHLDSSYAEIPSILNKEFEHCETKISEQESKILKLRAELEKAIEEEQALAEMQKLEGGVGIGAVM